MSDVHEDGRLGPAAPHLPRSWRATDEARPRSLNAERRGSHWSHRLDTREERARWGWLWKAAKVPPLTRATIDAYPSMRGMLADTGNCYPTVKAAIDALVDVGALPDDGPRFVASITLHAPVRGPDSMTVVVSELRNGG